jgi:hypothetical protein
LENGCDAVSDERHSDKLFSAGWFRDEHTC